MKLACTIAVLCAAAGFGQDRLTQSQPVTGDLSPDEPRSYSIQVQSSDYAAGFVDQRGTIIELTLFRPDGSRMRSFPGPSEGKRQFSFIAEASGAYRLELKTADNAKAGQYQLQLTEVLSLEARLKPDPLHDKYPNSRIEALRKQIAAGQTNTEAFWQDITREHAPLVEPAPGDDKHQLVTFLWRGDAETHNVFVDWYPFSYAHPEDYRLHRLDATDVWYVTVKVLRGARFMYRLSPNDPLVFDGPRADQRDATGQSDPLNPNRWACPPIPNQYACSSMVELPGAHPQPWIVPNPANPAGKVEKFKIKSELLKNERNLSVYTPAGYRADGSPYAFLLVFDESAYLTLVPTPVILDNLIAASKIPPTVAVLIANPSQETRTKELPPNPDFADFLAKELVPWMHARYNVTSDPRQTVVAGSSFGGIAATYAGLRHSEVFGNILSQSGSFWWAPDHKSLGPDVDAVNEGGWLAKQFIASPKLPLKFYLDAGLFEVDLSGNGGAILEPSRQMRDVLLAKGYTVTYQQNVGGHDYLSWRGSLADGLIALIGTATPASAR